MFSLILKKFEVKRSLHKLLLFIPTAGGIFLTFGIFGFRETNVLLFALAYVASAALAFTITWTNERMVSRLNEPEELLLIGPAHNVNDSRCDWSSREG